MKVKKILVIVALTAVLTRLWAMSLFYILNPRLMAYIVSDSLHHYHLGLLILFSSMILKKHHLRHILISVGTGILLEEWPVVLRDLGINSNLKYLSGYDLELLLAAIIFLYISLKFIPVLHVSKN